MNSRLHKSIQQIILAGTTTLFTVSALATLGVQNPPPGPGQQPDFFGITPNYANSPQPVLATVTITDSTGQGAIAAATTYDYSASVQNAYTGTITDIQVYNGGSGYSQNPTVTINGNGAGAKATATVVNGVITAITVTVAGAGYTKPIAGTGIRKFVDSLSTLNTANNLGQQLPVAVPDTTTFPGSDYYEIAETTYTQKLHSDLPPTALRGYKQLNAPAGSAAATNQYLGPVIVAQKDRPVRIKLVNQLPTGKAGNLPFPVDKTYMGSTGSTDTDNRTALHMHGGNTPWISDGIPRQWVKPAGEAGPNRGVSAVNVPDMYFVGGKVVPACSASVTSNCSLPAGQPQTKLPSGASNDAGAGTLTYFFTNQQSQRMMFYHDHAEGTTRLNVYGGLAAGYVLTDPTEQAMTKGGTVSYTYLDAVTKAPVSTTPVTYSQVLPADVIPLVIQEKTFVPDDKTPVLNFYGPFKSQLQSQDPTWGWGSGVAATGLNGNGDLWVPHVYMTNQNPGDTTGANALGRWDFGSWFWPPLASLAHPAANNAYYDPACVSSATNICQNATIPGMDSGPGGKFVSATPEAFNDTPLVNGTVYPYMNVEPKKYRLRVLSVGNDRILNLSLVVAASKNSPNTTADGNAAGQPASNTLLCDGTTAVNPADCTEVKMVPFNTSQDKARPFPAWWYTQQKGGVTFDGRPAGVFDPDTRGPAMVQIGTEGGFLSTPAVIRNQPVNFEYNLKNIVVTNVKEHALLLGPAERADVVVDFSQFAGSTIILYNDAPAPMPAFDLRLDYYTGDNDNTDTGGSFSTVPGYGPNSRTLLQFRVASSCSSANCGTGVNLTPAVAAKTSQDFVDPAQVIADPQASFGGNNASGGSLVTAVQTAFKYSQDEIIVPQAAYNPIYGTGVADAMGGDISRISDTALTFTPFANGITSTFESAPVTLGMGPKAIHELFATDYGRMNALLAIEIPNTNFTVQTTVPQYYVDPPTELVKIAPNDGTPITAPTADPINQMGDGTQLWRITHNGVDSHAIHFHLFNLQIVNRVGWDGAVRMPELNELGWKETVRMNPVEDVVVALRPKKMLKTSELLSIDPQPGVVSGMDFKVPNSHRVLDPSNSGSMAFYNLDPLTGNASNNVTSNPSMNFGWEYVWHCHILGHEENDMMRSIAVAQAPEAPSATSAVGPNTSVTVNWTDNSIISNWVVIQRDTSSAFNSANLATFTVQEPECTSQSGCALSYVDKTAPAATTLYYRVQSKNTVGGGDANIRLPAKLSATLTPNFLGYDNVTASSAWSNTVSRALNGVATITPANLTFANTNIGSTSTAQTVTVTNSGAGNLTLSGIAIPTSFVRPTGKAGGTCTTTSVLAPAGSCTVSVQFNPASAGPISGSLIFTDNSNGVANSTQSVLMTGTGTGPVAAVSPGTLTFATTNVGTTSAAQTVTLSNTGNGALTISGISTAAPFARPAGTAGGTCGTTLAAPVAPATSTTCTINVTFTPTAGGAASGILTITDNSTTSATQTVTLSGTGQLLPPVAPATPTVGAGTLTATGLTLNWGAVTGATSYTVVRSTSNTFPVGATTVTTTGLTSPTLAVTGLTGNTTYYYHVSATNAAGTSAYSGTLTQLTIPGLPTAVAAVNGTAGTPITAGLTWTAPAGGAASYNVRYAVTQLFALATTATNVTSGQQITVGSNIRFMQVQAVNASGTTAWSAATSVSPQ